MSVLVFFVRLSPTTTIRLSSVTVSLITATRLCYQSILSGCHYCNCVTYLCCMTVICHYCVTVTCHYCVVVTCHYRVTVTCHYCVTVTCHYCVVVTYQYCDIVQLSLLQLRYISVLCYCHLSVTTVRVFPISASELACHCCVTDHQC